ncbi:hypothetical protein ACFSKL_19405 [Belliella marina]|uniref:ParE toxin of type II toxin-antitoxin system, parDE n=1 Tax=Belliella marina TaxID=1644146 RepID=A0ABW4VTR4_9BACT
MTVLFLPEIRAYFEELSLILYEKEYFGFFEDAYRYADDLFAEIEKDLPNKSKKLAPEYFEKYGKGMHYTSFKRNKNTTWYVFVNSYRQDQEMFYLVRFLSNNHRIGKHL